MGVSAYFDEEVAKQEKDESATPAAVESTPAAEPTIPAEPVHPATPAESTLAAALEPAFTTPIEPKAPTIDALGRMHRPDGTVMSKDEQATEEARIAAVKAAAPAPVAEAAPVEPATPVPTARPYKTNVYGDEQEVFPGALIKDGHGVFIPEAQRNKFDQLTARGLQYDTIREDVRTTKAQYQAATERFTAAIEAIDRTVGQHFKSAEALQALVEDVQINGVEAVFNRIDNLTDRAALDIDRKFGAASAPRSAPREDAGETSTPPLDPTDARDAFDDYWTEILAKPDLHGMPSEIKAQLRTALEGTPLYTFDRPGKQWCINEAKAAPILAMAVETMKRLRTTAAATAFNDKQQPTSGATPAPPSVAAAKPTVGKGTVPASPKPAEQTGDPWGDYDRTASKLMRASR